MNEATIDETQLTIVKDVKTVDQYDVKNLPKEVPSEELSQPAPIVNWKNSRLNYKIINQRFDELFIKIKLESIGNYESLDCYEGKFPMQRASLAVLFCFYLSDVLSFDENTSPPTRAQKPRNCLRASRDSGNFRRKKRLFYS